MDKKSQVQYFHQHAFSPSKDSIFNLPFYINLDYTLFITLYYPLISPGNAATESFINDLFFQ